MISRSSRFLFFGFFLFSFLSAVLPFPADAAMVPCGRSSGTVKEQAPCTVCHFIVGGKGVIDYGLQIMTYVAIAVIVAMAIFYIVSSGNEGMMQTAKGGIKAAIIGFAVMLAAWLIVNTTLNLMAVNDTDPNNPLFGLRQNGTFSFSCDTSSSAGTAVGGVAESTFGSVGGTVGGGVAGGGIVGGGVAGGATQSSNYSLTVVIDKTGTGSGDVMATGINCGADCTEDYAAESRVILTAIPGNGSHLKWWSYPDCGTSLSCLVLMRQSVTVTATFDTIAPDPTSIEPIDGTNGLLVCQGSSIASFWLTVGDSVSPVFYKKAAGSDTCANHPGAVQVSSVIVSTLGLKASWNGSVLEALKETDPTSPIPLHFYYKDSNEKWYQSDVYHMKIFPVNGSETGMCGSAEQTAPLIAPTTDLCNTGKVSSGPTKMGGLQPPNVQFYWFCGTGVGSVYCHTQMNTSAPVDGKCGSSNGLTLSSPPTRLCQDGAVPLTNWSDATFSWTWVCPGANGGQNSQSCSAAGRKAKCGSSNGLTLSSPPTNNLCDDGSLPPVYGSGPWTWICPGVWVAACGVNSI